ncbi:MAG TPA: hypothetical protein VMR21_05390 [Vicinamibacteria bacterium]|nr:hypothetical protein [Vicinamibacteria bacterium]
MVLSKWAALGAVAAVGVALAMGASADSARPAPARPAAAAPAPEDGVVRVSDTDKVCMVNDHYMGVAQIPVDVDGKTYYGCCAMCEERLAKDRAVRFAVDPVSGKEVDKAKAVIGQRADGSVLYFESEANRKKYRAPKAAAR